MKYNPEIHHRHSIRLKGYDYSSTAFYFVTICSHQKQCLFGEIVNEEMILNEYGRIIAEEWVKSSTIREEIELDEWIVMPNHFHAIIAINKQLSNFYETNNNFQGIGPTMKPKSLSSAISGFKSAATSRINKIPKTFGSPVWQRNYYEHIIRDESSLERIREYIENNPKSWNTDKLHPDFPSKG
jgi:putative transposase